MSKVALVTGGNGWLALNLCRHLLHQGCSVRALLQPGQPVPDEDFCREVQWVYGDLREETDVQNFLTGSGGALLFHLAGIIHPPRWSKDFEQVNHLGTARLLREAERMGVARAMVMSSNSPFGCNPRPDHRFDEDSPYNPYMGYGRSKMRMELAVQEHRQLDWVLIRAPWFYGPYQPARQSLFFRMVRDGRAPLVGNGNNLRSMSYVDNLAEGLWLAAEHPQASRRAFWMADESPYSMNEIIGTIESVLREDFSIACKGKRMRLPYFVGQIAEVIDSGLQRAGLYQQKIHVLSEMNKTIACDVSLAQRVLGYAPRFALREGMRRSVEWQLQRRGSL